MTNISDNECTAMKYIFENKNDTAFKDLSAGEAKIIIDSKLNETCEGLYIGEWRSENEHIIDIYRAYRALAPKSTPNEIDWSVFPPEYKYCFTENEGICSFVLEADPETMMMLERSINVTDFPAFKRGTVAPKDSLLIRPEGI